MASGSYNRNEADAPAIFQLERRRRGRVRRNQEAHRQHVRFEKAVALEEVLRTQLGAIGQERDPEKFLLFREIDRVLEQLRTVAVTAKGVVHDQVFEQQNEAAFRRADGEQQIDHPYDRPVPSQNENAAAIRFFKDQAKALELFLFVGTEVLFLTEKLAEKIGQLVQNFENRGLNDDFAHGRLVIP
jgi:hypothetical protein